MSKACRRLTRFSSLIQIRSISKILQMYSTRKDLQRDVVFASWERVCGEFLGLAESPRDWSRKPASITQQSLHRLNGGLSDSRNTGRRWVFKKLARFGPRVGSFNSLPVFLTRSWTHEYFPLLSSPHTHAHTRISPSSVPSLVRSPMVWARPRAHGTLRRNESLFFYLSWFFSLFLFRQSTFFYVIFWHEILFFSILFFLWKIKHLPENSKLYIRALYYCLYAFQNYSYYTRCITW